MKKIFIILLLILSPILVSASEIVDVKIEPIENVYWNYYSYGDFYSGQFSYIYVRDDLGYSLDITKELIDESYKTTTENVRNSRVIPYAYLGYGYNGNNTKEYYMATQKIIWRLINSVEVYFTTGPNSTGEIIDIKTYEDEIEDIYNNHTTLPNYGENLIFNIGSKNIISNKNKISNNLNIINETNNNISIDTSGNLIIDANEIGSAYFYLETNYPKRKDNIVYRAMKDKKILVAGEIENKTKEYTYKVVGGRINLGVKFDKFSEEKITDNRFELYNSNDKLIGIYSPNEEGNITINNLKFDKYKLKHIDITEGYNKENNEYLFEINEQNLSMNKEIILNIKTTKVSINKTYGNVILNDVNYASDITYEIYNEKGVYINEVKTNENGYVEFNLDYGNYKIIESSLKRNVEYIEIDKTMFDSNNHFDIHTYEYKTNLKVIMSNKDTNEKISNVKFTVNDNECTTNEEGICLIKNIDFDTYKFSEININGLKKIDSFTYEINQNSEFYIENNEPYTEISLYLEEFIKENNSINNEKNEESKKTNNDIIENDNKVEIEQSDVKINEDIKEEVIIEIDKEETSNKIEEKLESNEEIRVEENNTTNIEKLPFLGDNTTNEDNKIIYYIYNFINFNWLQYL